MIKWVFSVFGAYYLIFPRTLKTVIDNCCFFIIHNFQLKLDSNQKSLKCKCLIRRSSLFFFQTNFGVCASIKKLKTFQTLCSKIKHYIFYEEFTDFQPRSHSLSHKITSLVSLCQSLFHCQSFKFKDLLTSQNAYRHLCAIYQLSQCNTYIR